MHPALGIPLDALERLVETATGTPAPLQLEEIVGGASVRRFFRVRTADRGSIIAMYAPAQSHEIVKPPQSERQWPFLEVRELLAAHGVRVPALVASACEHGLVLVEDLGETLAQHLTRHPHDREHLYKTAVADLARAQRALCPLPADSVVLERGFDEELLFWELEHFREWALEARGVELGASDRRLFDRAASHLAQTIASWPRGFVHRDYQSRNLMVVRDEGQRLGLGWIDFQDAMLGPRIYDMVALLSDSYQSFSEEFVEARLDEFAAALQLDAQQRLLIGREFRLVTVQRKLKDAGRFVFIERKHKNASFLGFVEPTVRKAQRALDRLGDDELLAELSVLLQRLFPRAA
ncbi:MAG TPA: phosphotransferase [Polyangiaceae bacterium]|nr:phosphotransferase [Polyangiaceae bacterium]